MSLRKVRAPQQDRGQAMVEFALVAPIFFLLVFSVIQLGLLFAAQNGLVNGTRETARRAATYRINEASLDDPLTFASVCGSIESELIAQLQTEIPGFTTSRLSRTVTYEWAQNPGDTTNWYLVGHITARYAHPLFVPIVGNLLDGFDGTTDGNLTLSASEQMRIENPSLTAPTSTPPACT